MKPITNLQPFIDYKHLSLHTVPLTGKHIQRDDKGKKKGFGFTSGWQEKFTKDKNTSPTPIGGLLTGRGSLIAIDCDCNNSWELMRGLDKDYTAFTTSIGKGITCGTILYLCDDDTPSSFRSTTPNIDLDFFNGTGMIFLPTEANATKGMWSYKYSIVPQVIPLPIDVVNAV